MNTITIKSEEARNRWRDMMDTALTGGWVIIQRYTKPQAILIGYEQWQKIQRRLIELEGMQEAKEILERIERGEAKTTSHEELKKLMLAKQAVHVAA